MATTTKQYKHRPQWLKSILARKRQLGHCQICKYDVTDHLSTIRTSFEPRNYRPLKKYSMKELREELNKFTIMCKWCSRIYMAKKMRQTPIPEFDPNHPCAGRLCNPQCTFHKKYQLCTRCFAHHNQIKQVLYNKVNTWKRQFQHCPTCGVDIVEGNELCFDLDHLDPYKKEHNIPNMIRKLYPFHTIKKEMQKCRLLCCHCHIDHTKTQRRIFQQKQFKQVRKTLKDTGRLPMFNQKRKNMESPIDEDDDDEYKEPEIVSYYNPLEDTCVKYEPPYF